MTDLTFAILKYGFLLCLWIFVWLTVRAINRDVATLAPRRSSRRSKRDHEAQMVVVGESGPVIVPVDEQISANNQPNPINAHEAAPVRMHSSASGHTGLAQGNASAGPAVLTIIDGPLSGTTTSLSNAPITLGRAANNTLVLDDEFVSSHHARVYFDAQSGQWAVEDLDSTNGTKVAGQPIHSACLLSPGVPVRIGATTFELR
ncbi:FHA domain-containing protein FhaB/FipA [Alloscardovia criceti]|uniref:FHA domain-containing protein FhaB/FipA n=1 Tax=Alloscardovia criceti TaxID=356828 RepID=UPI000477F1EA|nr:FHA domain-containing protein [Alloscardovia criceti]